MAFVALSMLPFVIDAKVAHIMLAFCSIPMLCLVTWEYRQGIVWKSAWPALVGAAISLPVGLYLFKVMSLDLQLIFPGAVSTPCRLTFQGRPSQ